MIFEMNKSNLEGLMLSRDCGQYEIAKNICSSLDFEDLINLSRTSQTCKEFLDDNKKIWDSKFEDLCQKKNESISLIF